MLDLKFFQGQHPLKCWTLDRGDRRILRGEDLESILEPFTICVEEGTYIANHQGEVLNSKSEWHQLKLIRRTTTVVQGEAYSLRAGGGRAGGEQGGGRRLQPRDQGRARGQILMKTLPKALRTRGLSSSYQSNFLSSYHKFKHKSWSNSSSESRLSINFSAKHQHLQ